MQHNIKLLEQQQQQRQETPLMMLGLITIIRRMCSNGEDEDLVDDGKRGTGNDSQSSQQHRGRGRGLGRRGGSTRRGRQLHTNSTNEEDKHVRRQEFHHEKKCANSRLLLQN